MSKKAATKPKDEITYEIGDIVLAKIRGFPAWPAQVVDPDNISKDVAKERPGGKKSTFYCVRFFPAGDHAWVPPKDLSKLKKHEIEAYINEPHKKNNDLLVGYRIALNPEDWEKEMEKLREQAEEAQANEEVDQLDGEEEANEGDDSESKPKKRMRESDAGSKSKKTKKDKDSSEAGAKKKKSSGKADKPKSKKDGTKSKKTIESEDDGERGENGESSKKISPQPTKKSKGDKEEEGDGDLENDSEAIKVKEMRHKLQRAFLGKIPPKPEDMPNIDALLTQVEQVEMPLKYLQYSKMGKVMRHIAALPVDKIPRNDEFKFKDRAQTLVNRWHTVVNAAGKPNGSAESAKGGADAEPLASTTNGNVVPSVTSDGQTLVNAPENNAQEMAVDGQQQQQQRPQVGDTTIADSAFGDITMSEVAA